MTSGIWAIGAGFLEVSVRSAASEGECRSCLRSPGVVGNAS